LTQADCQDHWLGFSLFSVDDSFQYVALFMKDEIAGFEFFECKDP